VKINGKLVEPGEAEAVLSTTPGVRAAAVLARTLASGKQQLVAHVEAEPGVTAAAVRAALRSRLPEHLCPSILVRHEQLPVNDRGKTDRSRLRSAVIRPWRDMEPAEHAGRIEAAALGIVAQILDLPELGVDDVLWDVGCDSLAAIEIAAALVDAFGSSLQPNDLLTARTVRELYSKLDGTGVGRQSPVVEFHPAGSQRTVFFIAEAGGPTLVNRVLIEELGTDQPVVVYEQNGLHQRHRPDRSLRKMARRYLADVRRRQPHGPYVLVGRSFGGLVGHEMARRLVEQGERVTLVLVDTVRDPSGNKHWRWGPARRPDRLRTRTGPLPVHALRLVRWRASLTKLRTSEWWRAERGRWKRVTAPVGARDRYWEFAQIAMAIARNDRRPVVDIPIWLVHPAGSVAVAQWSDHPGLVCVEVGGNHMTMMNLPHAAQVADAIRAVQRAVSAASGSTSSEEPGG